MTEHDRHKRAQDLQSIVLTLEDYKDQEVDIEIELVALENGA